ncbi:TonB-dependent receptor [Psychroflexus planctonicus]|uniref:TonB-dependent receptor n=1 Tax=Psychroflexus planctonicus TaxID=1526575 RepID=A0ABQ1SDK0_9FLAO|nr:TonB-dependent receptor [Psychroflexus planctonicus]GGE24626.1 TonB-dependent receptor [Psychroflexus planctonicus]
MKYCVISFFLCIGFFSFAQNATLDVNVSTEDGFDVFFDAKLIGSSVDAEILEKGFQFKDVKPGKYTLQVQAIGYELFQKEIELKPSQLMKLDILLQIPEDALDEVIILDEQSGISSKTPYSFTSVSMGAIQQKSSPNGLMGTLREVPGVYGAEFGQGIVKPFIRGLGFSRVVTVFQGNKLENQQWGADHGLGVNDLGVDRVDVIKGPASVLYGSGALGGVLLIKDNEDYLKSTDWTGNVGSSFNSISNGYRTFASIGKKLENDFYFATDLAYENHADYKDGDGRIIGNSRFNTSSIRLHTGIEKEQFQNKLSFTFHNQNLGIISENEMQDDSSLATSRNDRSMQLPFQEVKDYLLSYKQSTQHENFETSLHLSHHVNTRKEIEEAFDEVDLGFRQMHTFYNGRISLTNTKIKHSFGLQGSFLNNKNLDEAQEFLVPDASFFETGVYYMAEYEVKDYFFQGALRYDFREVTADASSQALINDGFILPGEPENRKLSSSFDGITGSLGVSKTMNKHKVKTNISTGFRTPDLAELFSNGSHPGTTRFEIGNANFDREQSYQADINYEYTHQQFSASLSVFSSLVDNYIFFSSSDQTEPETGMNIWTYQQVDARLYGGEFNFQYIPFSNNSLRFNLSGAMVRGDNVDIDEPLTFIPPDNMNFNVNWLPFNTPTTFSAGLRLIGEQSRPGFNEEQTDGYTLFNLGVSHYFELGANELQVGLTGNNLLNETYVDHMSLLRANSVTSPGRNIMLNLRFQF